MRLCVFTRLLTAAGMVLTAAPVFGQPATSVDLGVSLTVVGDDDPTTAGITPGGAKTYQVEFTNNGPTQVTTVDVAFTPDAALEITGVSGCEPTTAGTSPPPFPCTVTFPDPGLVQGAASTMTIDVTTVKTASEFDPAVDSCPAGTISYTSSVTISNPMQGAEALTNTSANQTDSAPTNLRDWADLEALTLTAPANTSEGQNIKYDMSVRNNGPCDAPRVRLSISPAATLESLQAISGDACAALTGSGTRCELGTFLKNTTRTLSLTYKVAEFPKSVIKADIPFDYTLASRASATAAATDDLNPDNDSAATSTHVDLSSNDSGCSTGGFGTLLALLPLAALRLVRRREA